MRARSVLGSALLFAGVATLTHQGVVYVTKGPGRVPFLPLLGAISLIAGIALLLLDTQNFKRGELR